jgi:hypothetical protein
MTGHDMTRSYRASHRALHAMVLQILLSCHGSLQASPQHSVKRELRDCPECANNTGITAHVYLTMTSCLMSESKGSRRPRRASTRRHGNGCCRSTPGWRRSGTVAQTATLACAHPCTWPAPSPPACCTPPSTACERVHTLWPQRGSPACWTSP